MDLSDLHRDEIKKLLKQELCKGRGSSDETLDQLHRYTTELCRDCEFGISSDADILKCEATHHHSIQNAVIHDERAHTLYFLNNLKSVVIAKIKVNNCYLYLRGVSVYDFVYPHLR